LSQRQEDVRDIRLVACQYSSIDTAANAPDDQLPYLVPGSALCRSWIEVRERSREHELRQDRVVPDEGAERLHDADKLQVWIFLLPQILESSAQGAEAFKKDITDQSRLVAEELIDRWG